MRGIPLARFEDAEAAAVPFDVGVPGHAERRGKAQQTGEEIHRGVEIRHVHERGDLEELSRHGSDHCTPDRVVRKCGTQGRDADDVQKESPDLTDLFQGSGGDRGLPYAEVVALNVVLASSSTVGMLRAQV
jgi:hypothetical protein